MSTDQEQHDHVERTDTKLVTQPTSTQTEEPPTNTKKKQKNNPKGSKDKPVEEPKQPTPQEPIIGPKRSCIRWSLESFGSLSLGQRTTVCTLYTLVTIFLTIVFCNWLLLTFGPEILLVGGPKSNTNSPDPNPSPSWSFDWRTITETPKFRLQMEAISDVFTELYLTVKKHTKDPSSTTMDISPYLMRFFNQQGGKGMVKIAKQNQMIKIPWEELHPNASITILNKMFTNYYQIKHFQKSHTSKNSFLPKNILQPFCFVDIKWPHIGIDRSVLINRLNKIKKGEQIDLENPRYKAFDFLKEKTEPIGSKTGNDEEGDENRLQHNHNTYCDDPNDQRCQSDESSLPLSLRRLPSTRMIPYMPLIMLDEHIIPTSSYGKIQTKIKAWIQTPLLIYVTNVKDCILEAGNEYLQSTIGKTEPIDYSSYRKSLRKFLSLSNQPRTFNQEDDYEDIVEDVYDYSEESYEKLSNMMKMVKCNIEGHVVNYNSYSTKVSFTLAGQTLQKFSQCMILAGEGSDLKTVQDLIPKQQTG